MEYQNKGGKYIHMCNQLTSSSKWSDFQDKVLFVQMWTDHIKYEEIWNLQNDINLKLVLYGIHQEIDVIRVLENKISFDYSTRIPVLNLILNWC